ncbi:uncharacterized protein LOC142230437 [Haematobia irritans]|uniref:uncharacterized protein LOC142230437 n=1 Tax=Haematobia irritans TaxID=7368 RepID=UPI003F500E14
MEQLSKEIAEIKSDINKIFRQQEEMAKLIAENNILLRRNLNLYESAQTLFPIDSDEALKKLDADLRTDRQTGIVSVMRKILLGNLMNIDRIIAKSIIMEHNYDGTKEKKSCNDPSCDYTSIWPWLPYGPGRAQSWGSSLPLEIVSGSLS